MMTINKGIILGLGLVAIAAVIVTISLEETSSRPYANAVPTQRTFYINTVHLDGITNINGDANHPPEPFPNSTLPAGGGYVLNKPDDKGNWKVRTFVFDPSEIVVHEGDQVTLNIADIQGDHHAITIEGHTDEFQLHRGELKTVTFTADKPGTINYFCSIHKPTMHGQILVLPRTE